METAADGARMATAACRLGCFQPAFVIRHLLAGCAFGVGGPRKMFWEGGRWFGGRARNDDDGGQNGYRRVSFGLFQLALVGIHLLGVRFQGWRAQGNVLGGGEVVWWSSAKRRRRGPERLLPRVVWAVSARIGW